jgi:hypothetical protein
MDNKTKITPIFFIIGVSFVTCLLVKLPYPALWNGPQSYGIVLTRHQESF